MSIDLPHGPCGFCESCQTAPRFEDIVCQNGWTLAKHCAELEQTLQANKYNNLDVEALRRKLRAVEELVKSLEIGEAPLRLVDVEEHYKQKYARELAKFFRKALGS